jgi:hypothetical protein
MTNLHGTGEVSKYWKPLLLLIVEVLDNSQAQEIVVLRLFDAGDGIWAIEKTTSKSWWTNEFKDAMIRDSKGKPAWLLPPEISKCRKGAGIIGKTGRLLDT